jgi:hypothetical protein
MRPQVPDSPANPYDRIYEPYAPSWQYLTSLGRGRAGGLGAQRAPDGAFAQFTLLISRFRGTVRGAKQAPSRGPGFPSARPPQSAPLGVTACVGNDVGAPAHRARSLRACTPFEAPRPTYALFVAAPANPPTRQTERLSPQQMWVCGPPRARQVIRHKALLRPEFGFTACILACAGLGAGALLVR